MILRSHYIDQIRPFFESDLIKVITGIRRCGKSVILSQRSPTIGTVFSHLFFPHKQYSSYRRWFKRTDLVCVKPFLSVFIPIYPFIPQVSIISVRNIPADRAYRCKRILHPYGWNYRLCRCRRLKQSNCQTYSWNLEHSLSWIYRKCKLFWVFHNHQTYATYRSPLMC